MYESANIFLPVKVIQCFHKVPKLKQIPVAVGFKAYRLIARIAGFETPWGRGFSSLVFVVCCVGIGLHDELITHLEESYRMCVCLCPV